MHSVVGIRWSLSSHCMYEYWIWGTIHWRLTCDIRMSLRELVHLRRLLHYYFLMLWIRSKGFIEFTWSISISTPWHLSPTYLNHIVDFRVTVPLKVPSKYFMYMFGITVDIDEPIRIHIGICQSTVGGCCLYIEHQHFKITYWKFSRSPIEGFYSDRFWTTAKRGQQTSEKYRKIKRCYVYVALPLSYMNGPLWESLCKVHEICNFNVIGLKHV